MTEDQTQEQKESVKLIKNSKGYNWEIKILAQNTELSNDDLNRLFQKNEQMKKQYGEKMEKNKWIWMPHAAHLIVGHLCRFHLATYVGKYIVSTVGEYWPSESSRRIHAQVHDPEWYAKNQHLKGDHFDNEFFKRFGFEEIGAGRRYETMVFKASKNKGSDEECDSCPYLIDSVEEVDMQGYNSGKEAYEGHIRLCNKWSRRK